jgi:hypothetical protein
MTTPIAITTTIATTRPTNPFPGQHYTGQRP